MDLSSSGYSQEMYFSADTVTVFGFHKKKTEFLIKKTMYNNHGKQFMSLCIVIMSNAFQQKRKT
jgi:hypothetical protein